jgi:hypothetical protein
VLYYILQSIKQERLWSAASSGDKEAVLQEVQGSTPVDFIFVKKKDKVSCFGTLVTILALGTILI